MKLKSSRLPQQCKLGLYSLAAGSLAVGNAFAAPTLSPNAPVMFETDDSDFFLFDIDDNGIDDFYFDLRFTGPEGFCDAGNQGYVTMGDYAGYAGGVLSDGSEFNAYGSMIAAGSMISDGPGMNYFTDSTLTACYDVGGGGGDDQFPVGTTGFIGLRFDRNGNTHFGYIEYRSENGSMIANVLEACFESDPDTAIEANSCSRDEPVPVAPTVPVPVAGVAVPLSLAMLALGGMALRRRKQQQA